MKCPKCGLETESVYCGNCGTKMPKEQKPKKPVYKQWWFWLVVGLFAIGMLGNCADKSSKAKTAQLPDASSTAQWMVTPTPTASPAPTEVPTPTEISTPSPTPISEADFKAMCKEISYKDIMRNPLEHFGENIVLRVQISQIMQGGLLSGYSTAYRCYSDTSGSGYFMDDEYYIDDMRAEGSVKLLEDDIITVYGTCLGTATVKRSLTGEKDEVAYISMAYCDLEE